MTQLQTHLSQRDPSATLLLKVKGLPFPNKLNGGDARLDGLKSDMVGRQPNEEPTSKGRGNMYRQQRRYNTGTQKVEAAVRREDSNGKQRIKEAATERGTYTGGSSRTGVKRKAKGHKDP